MCGHGHKACGVYSGSIAVDKLVTCWLVEVIICVTASLIAVSLAITAPLELACMIETDLCLATLAVPAWSLAHSAEVILSCVVPADACCESRWYLVETVPPKTC